jgi:hypothetical protein
LFSSADIAFLLSAFFQKTNLTYASSADAHNALGILSRYLPRIYLPLGVRE